MFELEFGVVAGLRGGNVSERQNFVGGGLGENGAEVRGGIGLVFSAGMTLTKLEQTRLNAFFMIGRPGKRGRVDDLRELGDERSGVVGVGDRRRAEFVDARGQAGGADALFRGFELTDRPDIPADRGESEREDDSADDQPDEVDRPAFQARRSGRVQGTGGTWGPKMPQLNVWSRARSQSAAT